MRSVLVLVLLLSLPSVASARVPEWWRKVGWVGADADDAEHPEDAHAEPARLMVRGAIKLRLATLAADIEVVAGSDKQVTVRLSEADGARVTFREEGGDRVELLFNGAPTLRCGRLCVEVPPKSSVELSSDSGDVVVRGVGGDVRARSTAGDVKIDGAAGVEARSISGDVVVSGASGEMRVDTVSGDIAVNAPGSATRLEANSTSGDVSFNGGCGAGCRMETRTLSGDVALNLGDKSSFAIRFASHGGEVADELGLSFTGPKAPREASLRARYGSGDGLIEAQTFSGDLHLARAK